MKASECVIDTVVYADSTVPPLKRGKIAGPVKGNLVIIEWDHGGYLGKNQINLLLNEADGLVKNQKLLEEKNRLELEFALFMNECVEKSRQVAKLIGELSSKACSMGKSLPDVSEASSLIESALSDAGWRTSSWHC